MGTRTAETVREIEQTREQLHGKILALEERMPQPAVWMKRFAGLAVGGGAGGTMFWFAIKRVRARKHKKVMKMPMKAVVNVVPERWVENAEEAWTDPNTKQWAIGAFGVRAFLKLAEIRALRRSAALAR
jgi:hypothetical protein